MLEKLNCKTPYNVLYQSEDNHCPKVVEDNGTPLYKKILAFFSRGELPPCCDSFSYEFETKIVNGKEVTFYQGRQIDINRVSPSPLTRLGLDLTDIDNLSNALDSSITNQVSSYLKDVSKKTNTIEKEVCTDENN